VAVGGTTLYLNSNATRSAETVWNENGTADITGGWLNRAMGATGGGCSTQVTAAGWQSAVPGYGQTGCGNKRLAADIAALADPYTGYDIYDTYNASGWQTYGGTSLASPLVAAMWAVAGGSGGVAYPALSLYGHFTSDPTHPLYDVTAGGNGLCNGIPAGQCANITGQAPNTLGWGTLDCAWAPNSSALAPGTRACDAATGYDGPSGVGTPVGVNAFKAMAPTARMSAAAVVTHRISTTLSAKASTDPFPGATFVSYDWTFGDGTAARTTTPSVAHTYAVAGTRSVTLKITDSYSRSASVTLPVTVR
jgi:subtilase family serine protease